ncbi:MAG: hypothetical protein ACLGHI_10350 [Gammaproteobacteria bacterium]
MRKQNVLGVLAMVCMALLLAGCTGEGSFVETSGTGGGTGGGGTTDPGTTTTPVVRLGTLENGTFNPGAIRVGVSTLSAGGSTGLRVDIVDTANNNTLVTEEVVVTFSSPCTGAGSAQIDSPITTSTGTANSTYRAQGCSGTDTITAMATVNGTSLSATGTVTVQPAELGSIEFVSANPTNIALKGSGGVENSTLVFRIKDATGGVVANQLVTFALNTEVGGIVLSPLEGTTDNSGLVQTTVTAGTVATTVRVTATATRSSGTQISTQSSALTITTGIPDQDSFSLAASCFNVEGFDVDGSTLELTVRMADRFNNPVFNDTPVQFSTEGGSIQGSCLTVDGACKVTWTSQDPRPADGRVTILATSIGEESFSDGNGNGLYDSGESFTDLPEAFRDNNENGVFDVGEFPADFNNNGVYDATPSGNFTGALCNSGCDTATSLNVRGSVVLVMSGSTPLIENGDLNVRGTGVVAYDPVNRVADVNENTTYTVDVVVRDARDQPLPSGTVISVAVSDAGETQGTTEFTVPCTTLNDALSNLYSFRIRAQDVTASTEGLVEILIKLPPSLAQPNPQPIVVPITVNVLFVS